MNPLLLQNLGLGQMMNLSAQQGAAQQSSGLNWQNMGTGQDIGGMLGSLLGGGLIMAGVGDEGGMDEYQAALAALAGLTPPEFDMSAITPANYAYTGGMTPEQYSAQVQGDPALVTEDPALRREQMAALAGLSDYRSNDLPLLDKLAVQRIQNQMGQEAQANTEAVREDLAMRGRLGGGQEAALRAGNQSAMDMAGQLGRDAQEQAIMARLNALSQTGQLAGGIRSQDLQAQLANAGAINRFNEWVSQLETMVAGNNAAARERSQAYNVGTKQDLSNMNTANRQATEQWNRDNQSRLQQLNWNNQFDQASAIARARMALGGAKDQRTAANQQNIMGMAKSGGGLLGAGAGLFF